MLLIFSTVLYLNLNLQMKCTCTMRTNIGEVVVPHTLRSEWSTSRSTKSVKMVFTSCRTLWFFMMRGRFPLALKEGHEQQKLKTSCGGISRYLRCTLTNSVPSAVEFEVHWIFLPVMNRKSAVFDIRIASRHTSRIFAYWLHDPLLLPFEARPYSIKF